MIKANFAFIAPKQNVAFTEKDTTFLAEYFLQVPGALVSLQTDNSRQPGGDSMVCLPFVHV